MTGKRKVDIAIALGIFALIAVIMVMAAMTYQHGGHPMAPGPIGQPIRKHLV